MNFSASDFVTPDNILSDITRLVDDEAYSLGSYGFYVNQMQYALQELAYDTYFDVQVKDFDIPQNLRIPMPAGSFNVREIYIFNGDMCNISSPMKVWWKRNYITGGNGYLARDRGTINNDPFYENRTYNTLNRRENGGQLPLSTQFSGFFTSVNDMLFYNIQNGMIMLSPRCRGWQKLAIVYNGIGTDDNNTPCIPTFLREAVKLWVADIILMTRVSKASTPFELNKWKMIQNDVQSKLNGRSNRAYDGAWYNAELRVKQMDKNARQDLKEYFSRLVK